MKIKNNKGFTLLELLIAITLMLVVMSIGGGIYLGGANLASEMVDSSQAHRTAQLAFMHIQKNVRSAASNFSIDSSGESVIYRRYSDTTETYTSPSITTRYEFDSSSGELRYYSAVPTTYEVVSSHIASCNFSVDITDGVVLSVEITALDNNNNPDTACTFSGQVETLYTASPAVFKV